MKRTILLLTAVLLAAGSAARAQTPTPTQAPTPTPTPGPPTTTSSGSTYATENAARVNGTRIEVAPNGDVWFLESSADRIAVLRGNQMTHWQLRPSTQLGANPVDFIREDDIIWFLESGESQIPAGTCALGRLDTTTGALTEWVIHGSIPAAFYKAPDGTYWIPQTGGILQHVDLANLQAFNYRSTATFAYADMVPGPDGALWLVDFGNNRIVRYVPGAATETSWTFFPPSSGRLNPSEIKFDSNGFLWISQVSGSRMDRFDPATNTLISYYGINHPIHFDFYQGLLYVTSSQAASAVSVLDPRQSVGIGTVLTSQTLDVRTPLDPSAITVRTSTITQTTFDTTATAMASDKVTTSGNPTFPGILDTVFDSTGTYGVAVADGFVWVGTDGKLAKLTLQSIGGPTDLSVPVATALSGAANNKIRVDLTLANTGTTAITGDALYLFSPGSFAARKAFTLAPGTTQVLIDAFGNVGIGSLSNGAVRLRVTAGSAADLVASVRSTRILPDGSTFGYALAAAPAGGSLGPQSSTTLFTGSRPASVEVSVLNLYTLGGAAGTLTLVSPGGAVRGTRPFALNTNTREEYNPAASAFGVAAEPGDVVRVAVDTGSLQASVSILDLHSVDIAESVPVAAARDFVIPNAGALVGGGGKSFLTDLYLSNPDPSASTQIELAFYPVLVEGAPLVASVTLGPGSSETIENFLPALFGVAAGQGALLVTANVPIAAAARIAARDPVGDYAGFAPAIDGAAGIHGATGGAVGLAQTAGLRSNLLLFNRGVAGTIVVRGFRADGTSAGPLTLDIGDHVATRINSVFAAMGVTDQPGGRIRIDVPQGMNLYAWTAQVDGHTGDVELTPVR